MALAVAFLLGLISAGLAGSLPMPELANLAVPQVDGLPCVYEPVNTFHITRNIPL